jgi:hypothetical protein
MGVVGVRRQSVNCPVFSGSPFIAKAIAEIDHHTGDLCDVLNTSKLALTLPQRLLGLI